MRIVVMGVGPIGGIIGGRLARAGNDVTLVEVDPEQVGAIREHGLQIDVPDGPFLIPVTILFPNEIQGQFDIAFIAVRSYHTKEVVSFLASHLTEAAILVSLQNGINPPALEEAVGPDRAIGTVIRMGSQRVAPGRVRTAVRGRLYIGHLHGKTTPQLHSVHTLLDAVIPTEMTDNISGILWSKLTYTCLGMFGSLADESLKTICEHEINKRLCIDFFAEVVGVGKAAGVRFVPLAEYDPLSFHWSRPLEARRAVLDEMARAWKSDDRKGPVRQLKRGDRPEVDQTVGYVVREGFKLRIPTRLCQGVAGMLHEIEAGKRPLGMQNYAELAATVE
jgi:2-dehydropantoate 2-reductase